MNSSLLQQYKLLEQSLNTFIPKDGERFSKNINMRLERISHLLEELGNPQDYFESIHIGGTSGKGTTSALTSSILSAAGYKTGLYMSPHLQVLNERYHLQGRMVSSTLLERVFNELLPAIEEVRKNNPFGQPSYFEVQTAIAFQLFKNEKVDIAVVEVGLGGELDATNVLKPKVSVLTNVGLDHTDILGDTIEKIAYDKCGIVKSGIKVISGITQPSAQEIISKRCNEVNSELWQYGKDFSIQEEDNELFNLICRGGTYSNLRLELKGSFQRTNAACAVAAIKAYDPSIPESAIGAGLRSAFLPGRFEVVQQKPIVILDGAHNIDKIKCAINEINQRFPKIKKHIILAIKDGKNCKEIIDRIALHLNDIKSIILTTFIVNGLWEPISPSQLQSKFLDVIPTIPTKVISDPIEAVKYALQIANDDEAVFVTGSLYLIGNVREIWFPASKLLYEAERMGTDKGGGSLN